jgi:hypothetical protein
VKTAAILLAAAVTGGDVPAPTYTHDELKSAIVTAMEFGRQLGVAEASAAIEEARKTLERCALARPI